MLFDLVKELQLPSGVAHFKGGYSANGKIFVTNSTYDEREFIGERNAGRLAE